MGLRQAGFDFARLTVDPSIFIVTGADGRQTLEQHALLIIRRLLDADLSVVVDLHAVEVNPAYGPEVLVDPGRVDVFADYLAMVKRVATMLRGLPPDRVALEPFNEPWIDDLGEAPRWQAMLEHLHAAAREGNPALPLVLNGLQWDSIAGLKLLDVRPFRKSNVLYTFHYYEPRAFTHQGVAPDVRWLGGLRWPEDDGNAQFVLDSALTAIAADGSLASASKAEAESDTRNVITQLLRTHLGPARIADDFAAVSRWAATYDIAPERIILGEFGCVADPKGAPSDRLAWLSAVRNACENAGFGWAYWAYKGNSGMSLLNAGLTLDRETLGALGMQLKK